MYLVIKKTVYVKTHHHDQPKVTKQSLLLGELLEYTTTMPHTPQLHPELHLCLIETFQDGTLVGCQGITFCTHHVLLCHVDNSLHQGGGNPQLSEVRFHR